MATDRRGTVLKWLRYLALVLAWAWAGWWTLFGLLAGVGEGYDLVGVGAHVSMPGLTFLAAVLVACRWSILGGGLLLLEGLATCIVFGSAKTPAGFLFLTLPPLMAGVLLLVARWATYLPSRSGV
jgi:hypothetical protein